MSPKYQDIIPPNPEKRSIRDIPLPERKQSSRLAAPKKEPAAAKTAHRKAAARAEDTAEEQIHHIHPHAAHEVVEEYEPETEDNYYQVEPTFIRRDGARRKKPFIKWAISAVVLVLLVVFVANLFSHATITIKSKDEVIALNGASFTLSSTAGQTGVTYDTITLSAESSVTADASEKISSSASASTTAPSATDANGTKATGKIVIYNTTATAQDLIATTRFETPEGLVYRITQDVRVPAKTTKAGKDVPGNVTVSIIADQSGEKYNSDPKDFTIPGFKGTSKYTAFYGRSSGPITGGSSVTASAPATVGASTNGTVEDRLREDLKNQLVNQVTGQIPENFVYIPNSMIVTYTAPVVTPGTNNKVTVSEKATATAIIIDKQSFISQVLVANAGSLPQGTSEIDQQILYDADIASLSASFPAGTTGTTLKGGTAKIILDGTVHVKAVFNKEGVARAVSTLSKTQAQAVISNMPDVESVDVSVTPFWKKNLPRADKITIK